jgi:hypothetical protein
MVNYAGRPQYSLSEQASILAWRAVIVVTRWLNRFLDRALPILLPLKPFWWIPMAALLVGFVFGLSAIVLLA